MRVFSFLTRSVEKLHPSVFNRTPFTTSFSVKISDAAGRSVNRTISDGFNISDSGIKSEMEGEDDGCLWTILDKY